MQRLVLIQHGKAKSEEEDADRPLNDDGVAESQLSAKVLRKLMAGTAVKCYHSGKTRAKQTAEIIESAFKEDGTVALEMVGKTSGLNPKDDAKAAAQAFWGGENGDAVIVGHLPMLQLFAGQLLVNQDLKPVKFTNSGIVILQKSGEGGWELTTCVAVEDIKKLRK